MQPMRQENGGKESWPCQSQALKKKGGDADYLRYETVSLYSNQDKSSIPIDSIRQVSSL